MKLLMLRKLHKWVALFVGLQLLTWAVSGVVFAWLARDDVSGERLVAPPPAVTLDATTAVSDPRDWRDPLPRGEVRAIGLRPLAGRWVYRVELDDRVELRQASDGALITLGSTDVRRLAGERYRGAGTLAAIRFNATPTSEMRGAGSTWQATFNDPDRTSLYFSAADGSFVAVRTQAWRLRDFFWMLHTMDYSGRDDFHHPLVILAASAAVWTVLTGLLLLPRVFRRP